MDPLINYLKDFILNQRSINSTFRKVTGLHRTHLEILTFANIVVSFNPYQVQQRFVEMNLQQVRLGIRKLISIGAIELWSPGSRNKPSVYMINKHGKQLLIKYCDLWMSKYICE